MLRRREEFREKLVSLIIAKDEIPPIDVGDTENGSEFPSAAERDILRYYYYIKHGVDTIHVSPMNANILKRINLLIPKRLLKWDAIIDVNLTEIRTEYTLAVKKAVVDFVLGESLHRNTDVMGQERSRERIELQQIAMKYRHRYLVKFLCAYK